MFETSVARFAEGADPQKSPVEYDINGVKGLVKVDHAIQARDKILVAGWTSLANLPVTLSSANKDSRYTTIRKNRPDVAESLGLEEGTPVGFVALTDARDGAETYVAFGEGKKRFRFALELDNAISQEAKLNCCEGVFSALQNTNLAARGARNLIALLPERSKPDLIVHGVIDFAYGSPLAPNGFVSGWVTRKPDVLVWLEDNLGRTYDIDCGYNWLRLDLLGETLSIPQLGQKAGFHIRTPFHPEARTVRICAADSNGVQRLPAIPIGLLPGDAKSVLKLLRQVETPKYALPERCYRTDLSILSATRKIEAQVWASADVETHVVGQIPENPTNSIVIPLYGRLDFIEHQLLEFDIDPGLASDTEIIYVLDDPTLHTQLHFAAPQIQAVCGAGFLWATSGENRGFSGANNLGASLARGRNLIFMNSDVIPKKPGWAQSLSETLDAHDEIGLLGPRLLFANGTIQHVGMEPRWRPEWGLFTNHHPLMGMDSALDPASGLSRLPLITGACVAMSRRVFDHLGGWDEGYISGDFEDSDLCFRVEEAGYQVAYDPRVELFHLERQSIALAQPDLELRQATTLVNACRYNQRWFKRLRGHAA